MDELNAEMQAICEQVSRSMGRFSVAFLAELNARQRPTYEHVMRLLEQGAALEVVFLMDTDQARIGFGVRQPAGDRTEFGHVRVNIERPRSLTH